MFLGAKSTVFAAALVLTGSTFAGSPNCPKLSYIKAEGISMSEKMDNDQYIGYSLSKYNTPLLWAFAIGPVDVNNAVEAIEITNKLLTQLSSEGTPSTENGQFFCMYETNNPNLYAFAVKANGVSTLQFKQFMH